MERAVEDVLKACLPVKSAAEKHQVSRTSLRRRLDAIRRGDSFESKAYSQSSMRVFSSKEELQLKEYLIHASKMGYGLSTLKLRSLAYEFAIRLKKRLPHSRKSVENPWVKNKQAGKDWVQAFIK